MITGDNPLTAVHVAKDVEIIDREALILDLKENSKHEAGASNVSAVPPLDSDTPFVDLEWRTVDETLSIPVDPSQPLDKKLLAEYDICVTGAALKQFEARGAGGPSSPLNVLLQHAWVYARVSPAQKELILTSLKALGYTTLMAGDGTNDVGALKQAHIGVALLDGTMEDLQKIAEHQKVERLRKVYESQLKISARFNQPPPPVPPALVSLFPDAVKAQKEAAEKRQANPMEKVSLRLVVVAPSLTCVLSSIFPPSQMAWRTWKTKAKYPRSS